MSEDEGEVPFGERTFPTYEEAWAATRAAEEAFAAALPERAAEIAGQVNDAFSGVLPEGMRFEWQTAEIVGRALDEMQRPLLAGSFEVSGTIPVEFYPGAFEAFLEALRPKCGALLFPLPSPVQVVAATGSATFLMDFSGGAPVQGPQPAVCALDKDHRIGWHWCNGTWWKECERR